MDNATGWLQDLYLTGVKPNGKDIILRLQVVLFQITCEIFELVITNWQQGINKESDIE